MVTIFHLGIHLLLILLYHFIVSLTRLILSTLHVDITSIRRRLLIKLLMHLCHLSGLLVCSEHVRLLEPRVGLLLDQVALHGWSTGTRRVALCAKIDLVVL